MRDAEVGEVVEEDPIDRTSWRKRIRAATPIGNRRSIKDRTWRPIGEVRTFRVCFSKFPEGVGSWDNNFKRTVAEVAMVCFFKNKIIKIIMFVARCTPMQQVKCLSLDVRLCSKLKVSPVHCSHAALTMLAVQNTSLCEVAASQITQPLTVPRSTRPKQWCRWGA